MKKRFILASVLGVVLAIVACMIFTDINNNVVLEELAETDTETIQQYNYNIGLSEFEATERNSWFIPIYGDYQIFCAHPGAQLRYAGSISYATAQSLVGTRTHSSSQGGGDHGSRPYNGQLTYPVYKAFYSGSLTPAMAYIASIKDSSELSGNALWQEKQKAIWNLRDSGLDGGLILSGTSEHDGPSIYDQEAIDYDTYHREVSGNGIQAENVTDLNDVIAVYNTGSAKYIVGPYTLDYKQGVYGDIAFAGISKMTAYGYNYNYELVNSNIEIEGFLLGDTATGVLGNEEAPQYFEPDDVNYVDRTEQVYPEPGQQFCVVFADPNLGVSNYSSRVKYIEIKVEFKYMVAARGAFTKYNGVRYKVNYRCNGVDYIDHYHWHETTHGSGYWEHRWNHTEECYLTTIEQQELIIIDGYREIFEDEVILTCMLSGNPIAGDTSTGQGDDDDDIPGDDDDIPGDDDDDDDEPPPDENIDMSLGGYVWEEAVENKESIANGIRDSSDISLKNIKVTLYEENGTLAQLKVNPNIGNAYNRINTTYTNEYGYYQFTGLDLNKKYYVVFEYNGLTYLPTEYLNTGDYDSVQAMVNAGQYNTENWRITSKALEASSDRSNFDSQFEEIGSYPYNYRTSDSLGQINNSYNATYSNLQLMGYTLDENGNYRQTGPQLIDGYLYNEDGYQTGTYADGIISTRIREYIRANRAFPSDNAIQSIYSDIAGGNSEIWRMLQFIEDSKITATTTSISGGRDLYPVYDNFIVNDPINGVYDFSSYVRNGVRYYPIYDGQYYINLGLWRRQENDTALRKDAYKATLKINNKTIVYDYDKRTTSDDYWEISVRVSDYDSYYNEQYNRELYQSDYDYKTVSGYGDGHNGAPLEVYVTYKLTIRNQSQTILTQIKEVVDYYDDEYTYREDLSWVTYDNNTVTDDEYYNAMVNENVSTTWIANAKNINSSSDSKYDDATEYNLDGYNSVYVRGLEDYKLRSGESAYIYLTFQVNRNNNGQLITDEDGSSKYNIAEINGYKTYYRDGTSLPNGVSKGSNDIAGLIDIDSNPGNLDNGDVQGDRYERNFEDDTDRAPGFNLIVNSEDIRRANGTVWEDERDTTIGSSDSSEDTIIGDGIRQDDEIGVQGVTVQLVEKCSDGTEYVWQTTSTDENGRYSFESYIPGDYVIRFFYGDTAQTALTTEDGGANIVSYNGQDYKSTIYQTGINSNGEYVGIDQNGTTDESGRYQGYIDTENQNVSGTYNTELNNPTPTNTTYGYDIYKSDADTTNYSDAKDLWTVSNRTNVVMGGPANTAINLQGRDTVNDYSDNDITNHVAEVLASPYEKPSYNGTEYTADEMNALYQELIANTHMTAETGMIVVEFEYNRQQTDGYDNVNNNVATGAGANSDTNGTYVLNNIDFGLVERPKAQLEIDKSISNVLVTLANNSILFDINAEANNAIWQDHDEYSIDEEKIGSDNRGIDFNNGEIGMYEEYYTDENRHRYSYRDEIDDIVRTTDKGLIQLTMDEELMHGATIQITYIVKITNVGEVDYVDDATKDFYYKGNNTGTHIATTVADQVVDYVANNLQFDSNNEINMADAWQTISSTDLFNQGLVNSKLTDNVAQFNTVIQTESFNTSSLLPGQEVSKTLILSQLITPENTDDDLTYSNMVEIAKTTNEVGRRMAYSVVGNQDPTTSDVAEVDSNVAERVIILPPFGNTHIYYIVGVIVAVILIAGIVLIRRKVLNTKNK